MYLQFWESVESIDWKKIKEKKKNEDINSCIYALIQ